MQDKASNSSLSSSKKSHPREAKSTDAHEKSKGLLKMYQGSKQDPLETTPPRWCSAAQSVKPNPHITLKEWQEIQQEQKQRTVSHWHIPQTFPNFPKLPAELREMVWTFACSHSTFVILSAIPEDDFDTSNRYAPQGRSRSGDYFPSSIFRGCEAKYSYEDLFAACEESHAIANKNLGWMLRSETCLLVFRGLESMRHLIWYANTFQSLKVIAVSGLEPFVLPRRKDLASNIKHFQNLEKVVLIEGKLGSLKEPADAFSWWLKHCWDMDTLLESGRQCRRILRFPSVITELQALENISPGWKLPNVVRSTEEEVLGIPKERAQALSNQLPEPPQTSKPYSKRL